MKNTESKTNGDQDNFSWDKSFVLSLSENSQLVFSRKVTVSISDPLTSLPFSDIVEVQELKPLNLMTNSALVCFVDNRTTFNKILEKNSIVHISNFFPLSREKYRMCCAVYSLNPKSSNDKLIPHEGQLKEYLTQNYDFNFYDEKKMSLEKYINICTEFLQNLYKDNIISDAKEKLLNKYWSTLNNEEKLEYETTDKDSIKVNNKENSNVDLDKYEAQEEIFPSKNFTIYFFVPIDVEHNKYPFPQVVANSRKPNFESLMKLHKKPKKFFFSYNFDSNSWKFKELYA